MALLPIAVLSSPVVPKDSVATPNAVLPAPVVFAPKEA
jgi:hypothetical protein